MTNHRMPVALPHGKGILFISGSGASDGALRVLGPGGVPAKTLVGLSSLLFSKGETMFAAPVDLNRLELTGPASPVVEGISNDHFRGADFDVSTT